MERTPSNPEQDTTTQVAGKPDAKGGKGAGGLNRRSFLGAGAMTLAAAATAPIWMLAPRAVGATGIRSVRAGYPFTLGVASGDPLPGAVVIWTRLAPRPDLPGGGLPQRPLQVFWEVATDEHFRHRVRAGLAVAHPFDAHSVHVDVHGLKPGFVYYYRFHALGEWSPTGRTKTAPHLLDPVDRFRFAFTSCQDFEDGFYTAYRHLVQEDLDLVVFLGDYIYEGAPNPARETVRKHTGDGEPVSLDEYRIRYALYKSDPLLQAAHAAFPWVVTLDDHEVDNDWGGDIPQDPELQSREAFLERRAAAFKAFWEHQPLRLANRPHGDRMQLFRRLAFGDLVAFNVLDTRQFRSETEPCGFGTGPLSEPVAGGLTCGDIVADPSRTMLGHRQERWLFDGLARSRARWNVLAQQVPVTRLDVGEANGPAEFKLDKWDAYPVARNRLFDFLQQVRPSNPVVITGDLHDNWVAHLKRNFDDPASETLACELIGTSISSDGDGAECSSEGERVLFNGRNPHVLFHNWRRGYVVCELTHGDWLTHFRILPYVEQEGAEILTRASFLLESGNPEAVRIAGADNCIDPFQI